MKSHGVATLGVLSLFVIGCASAGEDTPDLGDDGSGDQGGGDQGGGDQGGGDDQGGGGGGGGTSCTETSRSLLTNGNFDMAPMGMGWNQTPIDPQYPLISDASSLVQSAPNTAWLAGMAQANADDDMYQEVTVPATATALRLTGFYEVRTQELLPIPFDLADITLENSSGTVLESVLSLDNAAATTAWTAIDFAFPTVHAGQTVRLRLASSSDTSGVTNFFFDSLDLVATDCQ